MLQLQDLPHPLYLSPRCEPPGSATDTFCGPQTQPRRKKCESVSTSLHNRAAAEHSGRMTIVQRLKLWHEQCYSQPCWILRIYLSQQTFSSFFFCELPTEDRGTCCVVSITLSSLKHATVHRHTYVRACKRFNQTAFSLSDGCHRHTGVWRIILSGDRCR